LFIFVDPPVILKSPTEVIQNETNTAILNCVIEGKPLPTVVWRKDGKILTVEADNRVSTTNAGNVTYAIASLEITHLRNTDDGSYSCVVSNIVTNNVISNSGHLIVNCKYVV
jgi:hypothetical protein